MIVDGLLRVSDTQGFLSTPTAPFQIGSTPSTNIIDLAAFRDIAVGTTLEWNVAVVDPFNAGAGTLAVAVQGSVDATTWVTYTTTDPVVAAGLTLGRQIVIKHPYRKLGASKPRYLRLAYIVAGANFTSGSVKADLVMDAPRSQPVDQYPAGINVNV